MGAKKLDHHLVSLRIGSDACIHSYVMCRKLKILEHVAAKMMEEIEERGLPCLLPIFLGTKLSDNGIKIVRDHIIKTNPAAAAFWERAEADGFHLSMWLMHSSDPMFDRLMALH